MTMRMLIDARHREETRVAVVKGTRIEEFDFESAERRQLKGNIYLAKVTRVEPSLQAAFVDYGGNRHGFLAFSEIHPDYYQIPREDREALLREEADRAAEEAACAEDEDEAEPANEPEEEQEAAPRPQELHADDGADEESVERWDDDGGDEPPSAPRPESVAGGEEHAAESMRQKRQSLRHRYKIQDVIHRRQVLLVQVVKEERGNKGAALTTYLSLAGRYCVLMPNTSHGGGISRKISNAGDRKRLKSIMSDLRLPPSMGCIVRTAGLQRSSEEIKRDFDYLARLWDDIRETTLGSSAPALIHADSDLIKRAIRDIYNSDIDEVIVEGEEAYNQARAFMKLLSPTHAKKVKLYIDSVPLFQRGGVEEQLAAMYNPVVQLKSGGYLVINPTEALVSIDINSGRSTREHNIEQTALSTNLEAAHEIARQLRLRDMAGLIVIDFIDMESNSNNRKVEKAIKDALKNDRARIQVGRISSFGLFEMSRQRLRTGVLEASTRACPHCEGSGLVRTAASAGLQALRMLEEEAARGRASQLRLRASHEAAFYVLNRKRADIGEVEARYGVMIEIAPDSAMEGGRMTVDAGGPPPERRPARPPIAQAPVEQDEEDAADEADETEVSETERGADEGAPSSGGRRRRRRRRGGRSSGDSPEAEGTPKTSPHPEAVAQDLGRGGEAAGADATDAEAIGVTAAESPPSRPSRSRRRPGARPSEEGAAQDGPLQTAPELAAPATVEPTPASAATDETPAAIEDVPATAAEEPAAKPRRSRSRTKPAAQASSELAAAPAAEPVAASEADAVVAPKPRRSRKAAAPADPAAVAVDAQPEGPTPVAAAQTPVGPDSELETAADDDGGTPRRGWWQRTFGA